ncbi:hypothetical protein Afil01_30300 [Actinorhabdospora filicis]|uniref:Secreted protein n=1 Tax=Actinorhabdospora filicis TaxID=1785913 RepID=A0A9W6SLJ6_9ACTN|nr:hypothetical protein [Actinorhabdospora filicis]GLZ78223.1 hypothetical protein Afil01_30300 [Actinorhabdospora filicis]
MIRKRLLAIAAMAAMAFGTVLAGAGPAQAAATWEENYAVQASTTPSSCTYTTYYNACVQPTGELLWIKDKVKDGHRVNLSWRDMDSERGGICYNTIGVDGGWAYCNKEFAEGHRINWRVEYHDSKGNRLFSDWRVTVV